MDTSKIMWLLFAIIVPIALYMDLVLLNKSHGKISVKKSALIVAGWVSLALIFNLLILIFLGTTKATDFLTGYIIEYSLSIDNMFVFLIIFQYFNIPKHNQPKALLWGILGAVLMRFIFIFAGISLISKFGWIIYLFGIFLIFTAIKMAMAKEGNYDPSKNLIVKLFNKIIPISHSHQNGELIVKQNGKYYATILLACIVAIEASDVVFAIDSIPAILSITQDTFIVYTSNIFAVIGLRALYFMLSGVADKFEYLKYGISAVLMFVGIKMLISNFYHFSSTASLLIVASILAISIILSIIHKDKIEKSTEI